MPICIKGDSRTENRVLTWDQVRARFGLDQIGELSPDTVVRSISINVEAGSIATLSVDLYMTGNRLDQRIEARAMTNTIGADSGGPVIQRLTFPLRYLKAIACYGVDVEEVENKGRRDWKTMRVIRK